MSSSDSHFFPTTQIAQTSQDGMWSYYDSSYSVEQQARGDTFIRNDLLRCLTLQPENPDQPLVCKSGVIWVKILRYLNLDSQSAQQASLVCKMFRSIICMRKMHLMRKVASLGILRIKTFDEMATVAKELPTFRMFQAAGVIKMDGIFANEIFYKAIQLVSHKQFQNTLEHYFKEMKAYLTKPSSWMGCTHQEFSTFVPYAEKLVVPLGAHCIFKGDLHGDLHSLMVFIQQLQREGYTSKEEPLKLIKPMYLIFLGDYVDRGIWGLEVIYLLMLLKINNPENVFLIRGNHEDPEMTCRLGFYQEYMAKFGHEDPESFDYQKIAEFYNSLPVVLYLGTESEGAKSFVQCCHGGLEWGYNPHNLLNAEDKHFEVIEEFRRLKESEGMLESLVKEDLGRGVHRFLQLRDLCCDFKAETPKKPQPIGFMWHEFNSESSQVTEFYPSRQVFSCSQELAQATLAVASRGINTLDAVIRAHQHAPTNPLMKLLLQSKGCVTLWNHRCQSAIVLEKGTVLTLLLSPDSDSGLSERWLNSFTFDTTLHVYTAPQVVDWKCELTNNEIY